VSIGVPVYNGEPFLSQTLDSLLAQAYRDFELIISDNGSTDGTEAICRAYAAREPRVQYHRSPVNRGYAWNMNRLVELAGGEYFKWAMADDLCKEEMVARCVSALDQDPAIVLACVRTVFIDENDNEIRRLDPGWDLNSGAAHERLSRVIYAGGHWVNADALAGVIRRSALLRTRLLPSYQGGDKRPLGELSLMGKFREIPEYLYLRRIHSASSGMNNPAFAKDRAKAIGWMADFFRGSKSEVSRPTWHLMGDHLRTIRRSHLKLRHKAASIVAVLRAMRWNWRHLLGELV
jgi:glycosyltransferase involved in cell wall biosynthesis